MKRLLMAMLMVLVAVPAHALESAPVSSKRAIATLVTETDAMQPGQPFRVALRLRMADGWHTYWKNPGDAGVPPDLTIAGVTQSAIDWPTPRRVAEGPVMTYAYTGEVLLPVTVTAQTGVLKAHADWLVCKDICVPEEGDFSLTLPVGKPGPSAQAGLFAAHDRNVPRASPWTARISPDGTLFVQGPELTQATVTDAWFIPDQPDRIEDDAAQPLSVRSGGFTLSLKPAKGLQAANGLSGVLSVRDRAGLQTDVVVNAVPGPPPAPAMPPLGRILVFAFLGGLILPGHGIMLRALESGTAGLHVPTGEVREFPTNTSDALTSGGTYAIAGAIESMVQHVRRHCGAEPMCVMTGGAGWKMAPSMPAAFELVDNLIFDGLLEIAARRFPAPLPSAGAAVVPGS